MIAGKDVGGVQASLSSEDRQDSDVQNLIKQGDEGEISTTVNVYSRDWLSSDQELKVSTENIAEYVNYGHRLDKIGEL